MILSLAAEAELTPSFGEELKELWISIGASTFILTAFVAFLILILIYHGVISKNKFLSVILLAGLIGSLGVTLFVINEKRNLISGAKEEIIPGQVTVEGITSEGAVVSWETAELTAGFVKYGALPERLDFLSLDIRKNLPVKQHKVLLTALEPDTVYYYVIVSEGVTFDKSGKPLMFATSP